MNWLLQSYSFNAKWCTCLWLAWFTSQKRNIKIGYSLFGLVWSHFFAVERIQIIFQGLHLKVDYFEGFNSYFCQISFKRHIVYVKPVNFCQTLKTFLNQIFYQTGEDKQCEKKSMKRTSNNGRGKECSTKNCWNFLLEKKVWKIEVKMAKRFQTVAALGFMKTLLLLFNTAFWVSVLRFNHFG